MDFLCKMISFRGRLLKLIHVKDKGTTDHEEEELDEISSYC